MSNKLGTIAGIAVGIAIVTYVALNLIHPFKQHEEKLPAGAKVDEVFAGDVASAPVPAAAAPATAGPAAQLAAAAPAASAPSRAPAAGRDVPDIATPPDGKTPPKPAADGPTARDAPKDDAVEIEGASNFPMPDDSPASSPPAPPPAAAPAPEPKAAPAAAPEPAVAAAPLPRPKPDPVIKPKAPAPAAEVAAAAPLPETKPVPEPEAPLPAEKPKPAIKPAAVVAKSAPRADVLSQWWPTRSAPGKLNLLYAGQAANERSVGLLFDSTFAESADFGTSVQLLGDNGKAARGQWELNSNRRMLLFKGLKSGRYTVIVSSQLANEGGLKLGNELHGPVYIR